MPVLKLVVWHVFFPLGAGAAIYLLFRSNTLISNFLQHLFGTTSIAVQHKGFLCLVNTVPDFCWCYSFSFALLLLLAPKTTINGSTIGLLAFLVFSEVLQLGMPHFFTFDLLDIVAAVSAFVLSLLFYQKNCLHEGSR